MLVAVALYTTNAASSNEARTIILNGSALSFIFLIFPGEIAFMNLHSRTPFFNASAKGPSGNGLPVVAAIQSRTAPSSTAEYFAARFSASCIDQPSYNTTV